jgi:hypothetical protein
MKQRIQPIAIVLILRGRVPGYPRHGICIQDIFCIDAVSITSGSVKLARYALPCSLDALATIRPFRKPLFLVSRFG